MLLWLGSVIKIEESIKIVIFVNFVNVRVGLLLITWSSTPLSITPKVLSDFAYPLPFSRYRRISQIWTEISLNGEFVVCSTVEILVADFTLAAKKYPLAYSTGLLTVFQVCHKGTVRSEVTFLSESKFSLYLTSFYCVPFIPWTELQVKNEFCYGSGKNRNDSHLWWM